MTEWQWAVAERHPADFLRGLFHADGCWADNWIRGWCADARDLLDVAWRQWNWKTSRSAVGRTGRGSMT